MRAPFRFSHLNAFNTKLTKPRKKSLKIDKLAVVRYQISNYFDSLDRECFSFWLNNFFSLSLRSSIELDVFLWSLLLLLLFFNLILIKNFLSWDHFLAPFPSSPPPPPPPRALVLISMGKALDALFKRKIEKLQTKPSWRGMNSNSLALLMVKRRDGNHRQTPMISEIGVIWSRCF